jgi:hypothetical protein
MVRDVGAALGSRLDPVGVLGVATAAGTGAGGSPGAPATCVPGDATEDLDAIAAAPTDVIDHATIGEGLVLSRGWTSDEVFVVVPSDVCARVPKPPVSFSSPSPLLLRAVQRL